MCLENRIQMAFEIVAEDIQNVLEAYSLRVTDTNGMSFEQMSEDLITRIDLERVERAGIEGGSNLEEQTIAAYKEIHKILVEMGVLEF